MTSGLRTFLPARFSPTVFPVTVIAPVLIRPPRESSCIRAGMPPAWWRSARSWGPPGDMKQRCGVLSLKALNISRSSGTPASLAIAGRWSEVLVEPPKAMSTVIALAKASAVRIVGGLEVLLHQLHDLHPRLFRQADPLRPDGRDRPVSRQAHPQDLGEAVHRIGREHPRAGADARAGASLRLPELIHRHLPDLGLADVFEDFDEVDLLSLKFAGEHRAAADHDRGDVEARRGHQHPGDDLVAVGDEDQAVERVGHDHRFDGVGDQFAGAQRVLHPLVAHDDAVAYPDREELDGRAPRHPDAGLDRLGDLVQMEMAGDDLVGGVGDADHRPFDLPIRQSQRLEQGAVRGPLQPFLHRVGTHIPSPFHFSGRRRGGSPFRTRFLFIQRREQTHAGIGQRDARVGHGDGVFVTDAHAALTPHALPDPSGATPCRLSSGTCPRCRPPGIPRSRCIFSDPRSL